MEIINSQKDMTPLQGTNVVWLIHGDYRAAGARLQAYHVHQGLRRRGINSWLLQAPLFRNRGIVKDVVWSNDDQDRLAQVAKHRLIVIIHKLRGVNTERLIAVTQKSGAKIIYTQCDLNPHVAAPLSCDAIVCPSQRLAAYYRDKGAGRVEYIMDPVEWWNCPNTIPISTVRRGLSVCWVGHRDNWHTLDPLRNLLSEPEFRDMRLVTISDHADADIPWSLKNVREAVPKCDLAVVPSGSGDRYQVKSSNRVALFMAAGLPLIAGRIESYEELITPGWNGFLAAGLDEYRDALRQLRDPEVRDQLRCNAYEYASGRFHIEHNIDAWVSLLERMCPQGCAAGTEQDDDTLQYLYIRSQFEMSKRLFKRGMYTAAWPSLAHAAWSTLRRPSLLGGFVRGVNRRTAKWTKRERE